MRVLVTVAALSAMAFPVAGQDWSGFYAGLSAGKASGDMQYFNNGAPDTREDIDGSRAGLFAGYNVQSGALVYGGELAWSTGDVEFAPGYGFTDFLDVKGRLGYATGTVLVYGTLGYTTGNWEEEGFPALTSDGLAYGLGMDVRVSDRFFVGGEYLWRKIESEHFPAPVSQYNVDGDFGTFSLRLGLRF